MMNTIYPNADVRTAQICPEAAGGYPFQNMLFGINLEITRRGFWGGLCAEMLNNRKLYSGKDAPSGWECTDAERVTDHPERSLCGSNYVILHNGRMTQTSDVISLCADQSYTAAVWVKALSDGASVTFGVGERQMCFAVVPDAAQYTALSFVIDGMAEDGATFVISAEGDVAVFEASLLPTDHFFGMRRDVVEHLRTVAPTSIRFPGGCCADHFDWKESLKDRAFRTPTDGTSKSWFLFRDTYDQDCLDIGLNEFMMLCRALNAEPEYTVSLLLSDGEDARRLVEYCNGGADTEYGAKRQALGFDAFDIKLWYIGNEVYFFGGEQYLNDGAAAARKTDELIEAMRRADDGISVVIGLTWAAHLKQWNRDFVAAVQSPYEYVSYHNYIGILPDASQGHNGYATCEILENNFRDGTDIGFDFYKHELYGADYADIHICADEWNYSWGCGSSNALFFSNALQFHFFAKSYETYHIERAEFFMPVNEGMITVRGAQSVLESTGYLFPMMMPHKDGTVVGCSSDDDDLDILCTAHDDGTYFVSIVNRAAQPCTVSAAGYEILSCSQICVGEYSFDNNDFAVCSCSDTTVGGHSVLFLRIKPQSAV